MSKTLFGAAVLAGALTLSLPAFAHVTLETQQAAVGSTYKAVLRVPHGCDGAATTAIKVQIPEGVIAVKPMPKAGWTLTTTKGKYAGAYDYYGEKLAEGVTEVTWSGGNLPDEFYDEFVFRAFLTDSLEAGKKLYFPVVQECGDKAERWIDIPADGKGSDDYETPAPGLKLTPKS
jgi:uncharacterized protein YcnI